MDALRKEPRSENRNAPETFSHGTKSLVHRSGRRQSGRQFWLNRELKKAALGLPVMVFANVLEAFDFLLSTPTLPAVVFLDLHLPVTSGLELLRKMKAHPSLSKVLVFVLNGSSSPREIEECETLGVAGFLDKPVSLKVLVETVAPRIGSVLAASA